MAPEGPHSMSFWGPQLSREALGSEITSIAVWMPLAWLVDTSLACHAQLAAHSLGQALDVALPGGGQP